MKLPDWKTCVGYLVVAAALALSLPTAAAAAAWWRGRSDASGRRRPASPRASSREASAPGPSPPASMRDATSRES